MKGRIKVFLDTKNFGFIICADNKEYFFHISDLEDDSRTITEGQPVRFEPVESAKGLRAKDVIFISTAELAGS